MPLTTLKQHPLVQTLASLFESMPRAEVFAVGGVVRNALLGRPFTDVDVIIRGLPIDQVEDVLKRLGRVDRVGKRFGVLKVWLAEGRELDVALPRTDQSFRTGRYRDVAITADPDLPIEADLARRDLTVNAIAWDIRKQRLVDPFGGQADLAQHLVRAVGDPRERFQEDATRILRAVRFAVQLNFTIEPVTADAMSEKLPLLNDQAITPREVIAHELTRAFVANPVRAFDLWDDHGLFQTLIPEVTAMKGCAQPAEFHAEGDVWTHTRLALMALTDPGFSQTFPKATLTPQLVVAVLLHDVGKPPTQKTPERDHVDRIRFDRHAPVGAQLADEIGQRLRLDAAGVDLDMIVWCIEHHLDILNLDSIKPSTLEQTYLRPVRGPLLLQLTWADSRASLGPDAVNAGRQFKEPKRFAQLRRQLAELQAIGYEGQRVKTLLSGDDIMRLLGIAGGPRIGQLLQELRDAQLSGKVSTRAEAEAFVRKRHAH
ncbi:MAG: CCA tRNA nucleotidyltransferase [Candidatus Kerfeldbacteria bacterium]|nr:CCA tRNA nucleotidyltransferase [Candidatus Kerfeldbacteria bacterium]